MVLLALLTSCAEPEQIIDPEIIPAIPQSEPIASAFYRYQASTSRDFLDQVNDMGPRVTTFLNAPNAANLTAAQQAWLNAHSAFSAAQFGFISNSRTLQEILFRVDAWPIQPGFIDNLPAYPVSGIVFDETLSMDMEHLLAQHGITDDEEVILGFHALELLLFTRSVDDYVMANEDTDGPVARRRELLKLVAGQFVQDADLLVTESSRGTADLEANALLHLLLQETLRKIRNIYRESNLVAAQGSGHALNQPRSLAVLDAELLGLEKFLISEVPLVQAFESRDPATYNNFLITLEKARSIVGENGSDPLALGELPLVLAALTHQLEAFTTRPP
jgi:hypothetical protein